MTRLPNLEEAWRRLFDPRTIIPFLFGSVMLGVLSNGVYALVMKWVGDTLRSLIAVIVGTLLIFVFCVAMVAWRIRTAAGSTHVVKRRPEKHRGLILLVSQEPPCRKAVAYHSGVLKQCWMICSTKTLDMAGMLRREFDKQGILIPDPIVVNDVYDPKEYCDRILEIYDSLPEGWQTSDVITDYLGMTSHASVGVVLAWHSLGFPLQYTVPVFDDTRRVTGVGDPIEISLSRKDRSYPPLEPPDPGTAPPAEKTASELLA